MATIQDLVKQINKDLSPQFEERLRAFLADKDREWLVDQLVRLTMDAHALEDLDTEVATQAKTRRRAERLARVTEMAVDSAKVRSFTSEQAGFTREDAIRRGLLLSEAPAKGTAVIERGHRTAKGDAHLVRAKDMLFALLFGDASTATHLDRVQQELLTLAVPRSKADALDFMRASTQLAAEGTWQDPKGVSNDEHADNMLLQVQFGEASDEIVGTAIIAALSVINNLEINEQVLYARVINIEESNLIS